MFLFRILKALFRILKALFRILKALFRILKALFRIFKALFRIFKALKNYSVCRNSSFPGCALRKKIIFSILGNVQHCHT